MNYTLNQLRILVKLFEMNSITKTAEALFLTQPAVSIQLKKLQEQFDVPLYEIINKRVHFTDFGKEICKQSQIILNEVQIMKEKSLAYKGFLVGSIKISIVSTGKYVMPFFLTDFIKQYPALDLTVDVTNKQKVVQSLEENTVDFSLVSVLPDHLKLNRIDLMSNKLYLVGAPGYKIKNKRELNNFPLIFREKGSATRVSMETYIKKHDIQPTKTYELTSNEAVKQSVMAGIGLSIMPVIGIRNEIKLGLLEIYELKNLPIVTQWNLVWLSNKELSPAANAYIDFLHQEKERISKQRFVLE
ncbi:MAG: LysR family transcriptional regulator [Flavobacteriales bacterium]|nr:LysR family transcriptional regulator [Flavobacteriales bacterium]